MRARRSSPLGRQRGRAQVGRRQLHELKPLRGRHDLLAAPLDIKRREELFDDVRAGRGRAEAARLLKDPAQLLVGDLHLRMLHGSQQGRLGIARRGRRLAADDLRRGDLHALPLRERRQRLDVLFLLVEREAAVIGRAPARLQHDPALGREGISRDRERQLDLLIFARRQQHGQKPPHHEVIDVALRAAQLPEVGVSSVGMIAW